jgi:hypothetical protein
MAVKYDLPGFAAFTQSSLESAMRLNFLPIEVPMAQLQASFCKRKWLL